MTDHYLKQLSLEYHHTKDKLPMNEVDPFRFTGKTVAKIIEKRIAYEKEVLEIPWAPVSKKISSSKVALLTTAGISMKNDEPFDMETERIKGNWGDPTWRLIDSEATSNDINVNHLHIDTSYIEKDINVALPTEILKTLVSDRVIGSIAKNHYSIMGFQGEDSSHLANVSGPEIANHMKQDKVDLAILAPV